MINLQSNFSVPKITTRIFRNVKEQLILAPMGDPITGGISAKMKIARSFRKDDLDVKGDTPNALVTALVLA